MPEISSELHERFRAHAHDASHTESVVVTLRPGVNATVLDDVGMEIDHTMRNQPIVSGRIDAATLRAMTTLEGVVRVEPDNEMRALSD